MKLINLFILRNMLNKKIEICLLIFFSFIQYISSQSTDPILIVTKTKSDAITYQGSENYLYVFHDVSYVTSLHTKVRIKILVDETTISLSESNINFCLSMTSFTSVTLADLKGLSYSTSLFGKFKVKSNSNSTVSIDSTFDMISSSDATLVIRIPINTGGKEIKASAWIAKALSVGAIVGIVIGCFFGLVLIIVGLVCCCRCMHCCCCFSTSYHNHPVCQPAVIPVTDPVVNGYIQANPGLPNYVNPVPIVASNRPMGGPGVVVPVAPYPAAQPVYM